MKLKINSGKIDFTNTPFDSSTQSNKNEKQCNSEEHSKSQYSIEYVYVPYTGKDNYHNFNVSAHHFEIHLDFENTFKISIVFYSYDIENDEIIFYDKNDEFVTSLSNISEKDMLVSKLKERIEDGHAYGLAEYLKNKNLSQDDEELYLEHVEPIIFWGAQKYLAQWKVEELQKKTK